MPSEVSECVHALVETNLVLGEFDIQNFTFNLMFIKSNADELDIWGDPVRPHRTFNDIIDLKRHSFTKL